MITKGIIVITTQGFGNRLKMLASSYILAKFLKLPLYLCWDSTPECNIKFNEVFDNQKDINEISLDDFKDSKYVFFGRVHTNSIMNNIKEVIQDDSNEFEYLLLEGGHEFKHNLIPRLKFLQEKQEFYSNLIFNKEISTKYNDFISEPGKEYIAIHYRDINEKYDGLDIKHNKVVNFVENSPIEKFFNVVDKIKSTLPIIIISNTDKFYREFSNNYVGENTSRFKFYTTGVSKCDRDSNEDMISSIVDFKILTNAQLIIGNYFSSFSDEASFFNLIPKITPLSDELIENIQSTVNNYHGLNYSFIDNIAAVNFNDKILIKHLHI